METKAYKAIKAIHPVTEKEEDAIEVTTTATHIIFKKDLEQKKANAENLLSYFIREK